MMRLALSASALAISTSWRCAAERSRASASSGSACSWPRSPRISLARRRMAGRDSRPGRPRSGRKIFSRTERSGAETRLLHHHGDAGVERLARVAHVERLAAIDNLARIAADVARDDPRQRRLSGPVRPEQACVTPGRKVICASTSARVCAKLFEIARASRSGIGGSVIVQARGAGPAFRRRPSFCHCSSLANTVSLMVGRIWSMFLLVATTIGTRISFSGLPPLIAVTSDSPDFTPMR